MTAKAETSVALMPVVLSAAQLDELGHDVQAIGLRGVAAAPGTFAECRTCGVRAVPAGADGYRCGSAMANRCTANVERWDLSLGPAPSTIIARRRRPRARR
jgi:hypothetical protein